MEKNMTEWLNEIKTSKIKKSMPVLSFPAIQLMNISVKDLITSSDNQATAMKIIADRFDTLASVSLMDLSVEAEAFGSEIRFYDDEVPTVVGRIIRTEADIDKLEVPEIGVARTGIYVESIEKAVELIKDRPIFAGVIGPFSLAGRLMDVTEIMINCYIEPDLVHKTLDKATQFIIDYIKEFKKVGANGIVIAEPLAGMLSPDLMNEFATPYAKRIVEAVQDDEFIVIYHNCGNDVLKLTDSIIKTGAYVYHYGNAIDMSLMMELMPSDVVIMGNIDPAGQFRNGTKDSIRESTLNIMNKCCSYPNFIISSGCDIPPLSKIENIDAFFKAVEEFYSKYN